MPIPIMPKRSRSLGATDWGRADNGSGSRKMVFAAKDAPAAAAPISRNSRREKLGDMRTSRKIEDRRLGALAPLFFQHLERDFLEIYSVSVVLQADVAFVRARSALWLEIEVPRWNRVAFFIFRDLHAIQNDDRSRTIQCDLHCVPLRTGLAGFRERPR